MADDKKSIGPEVETPTEAPASGGSGCDPVLTTEETVILEHEGRAAHCEMGEFLPDPPELFMGDPDKVELVVADPAWAEKEAKQTAISDKGDPAVAPSDKMVDFAAAREDAGKDKAPKEKAAKQKRPVEKDKGTAKARKGRLAKADKVAPDKAKPPT